MGLMKHGLGMAGKMLKENSMTSELHKSLCQTLIQIPSVGSFLLEMKQELR